VRRACREIGFIVYALGKPLDPFLQKHYGEGRGTLHTCLVVTSADLPAALTFRL
jgi:hypothetical protein